MEDNKKIPENNEASIEESKAGAKKPLPKSTIIVGAISAVIIIVLAVALILSLGSKKPDDGSDNPQNDTAPTVTVDKDGYVVVNGTKTEIIADKDDVITVDENGFVIVNGTKTEYEIKKNHSFGEWTLYNEGETDCAKKIYRRTCSDCSAIEWKEGKYEDHVWGTEYISDASQHWKKCKNCAVLTAKEDHTEGDEGICALCDAPLGDTAGIVYGVSADGTYAEVVAYEGTAKKVKIASEYNGLPVKTIYSEAFKGNNTITSVIIPDSVTSIGSYAFYSCDSLVSVVIPDSVTRIGFFAFEYCNSLTSVVIGDSVTSIGDYAFNWCDSLESVVIGDSVTSIGGGAFAYCSSLESVVIPDSVESIGSSAFNRCSSLRDVYYTGTEEEWKQISIDSYGNSYLTSATKHYNYVPEE